MSENTKKLVSFLIALSIVFSVIPMQANAQTGPEQTLFGETELATLDMSATLDLPATPDVPATSDVPGQGVQMSPEYSELRLEPDVAKTVTIQPNGYYAYLLFVPTETGRYRFTSISSIDTCATLYQAVSGRWSWLTSNDDGGENNNFMISRKLLAGHIYMLRVNRYGGGAGSFQVQLTVDPTPQSISFSPINVVENTNGYLDPGCDAYESYYCYYVSDLLQKSTCTATLFDGTELTGSIGSLLYGYDVSYSTNQSADNPWTAGNTYYINVHVEGLTAQVPVTIVAAPLQSITFTPVSVAENTNGYFTEDWDEYTGTYVPYYYYDVWNLLQKSTYTATFADGTVLSDKATGLTYDGMWYAFDYSSNQSASHPWTVGHTYYIDVSVMGRTVQLPVTITETPLQSITFTPVSVEENTHGDMQEGWNEETQTYEAYYHYDDWALLCNMSSFTATFADGTVLRDRGSGFYYDDQWYSFDYSSNQSASHPWTVGNTYYIDVSVMGQSARVPVTIVESPVAGVTVNPIFAEEHKNGSWDQDWEGGAEYFRYNWTTLLTYTITFKDGTVKQGGYNGSVEYNGEYYSLSGSSDNQSSTNPWLVGNTYSAQVTFSGQDYDVFVTICKKTEDNGFQYMVQDGKVIITGCTTGGEILAIPETIDGYPVVGITSLGDALGDALEIRIPDSVTMLSSGVFGGNIYGNQIPLEKLVLGKGISTVSEELLSAAWWLEWIEVSEENPYYCSIDGVLYNKAVTTLLAYPPMKQGKCMVPDSVTSLAIDLTNSIYTKIDIQFGAGIEEYQVVDGVIYNSDMTTVLRCTSEATGSYTMPETVTDISRYAFQHSNLTSVTISPNVTSIVYGAFFCSTLLKEITIPESVTQIGTIAFSGCESLEKAHIPSIDHWCRIRGTGTLLPYANNLYIDGELVKDLVIPDTVAELYDSAFEGGSFETVAIPPSVQEIGFNAFADCENLEKVYITDLAAWCSIDFDYEEANPLYHMEDLYLNGELITDMVIPEGVQAINRYAFYNGSMKSVTVPSSVREIDYEAFRSSSVERVFLAEGLQSIDINAFRNSAITSVTFPDSLNYLGESAFYECAALQSVDIGGGLTCIDEYTFYRTGLNNVTIPKQVTEIRERAFARSALTQVQFDCDTLKIGWEAFQDCPLGELELGENIREIQDHSFEGIAAAQVILPPSVTRITYRSFAFNDNLVSVTIPDTVTDINPYAFERDTKLSHVLYTGTQDQWNALAVESLELNQATLHCEAVGNEVTTEQTCTHIRFFCTLCDKWEAVKKKHASHSFEDGVCTVCGQEGQWEYLIDNKAGEVTVIGYVGNDVDVVIPEELEGLPVTAFTAETFAYSRKLLSVTVPGTVREIASGAFRECKYLESVTVESGVTTIGSYAFYRCRNLVTVVLPDTVTTVEEYAFYLNDIASFRMSEGLTTVGAYAFYCCGSFRGVTLPQSLRTIGEGAFYSCDDLDEVIIPEGVTEIGPDAFRGCYLDKVQLPGTLVTIGENAFRNNSFKTLEIPASVETIGADAFYYYYSSLHTVTFLGAKPAMEDAFGTKLTAFYDPATPGWAEYLAGYQGNITWYAANAPEIRVQPQDVTVTNGSVATVSAEGYGHRLRYQWYYAPYGSDTFTAIGGNCFELSMVMDTTNPNVRAYCEITDVLGHTVTTETVTMKLDVMPVVKPTLKLKAPSLEFKDMICVIAFYTAENTQDVVEMGMVTYTEPVDVVDVSTADHVIPGAGYEESTGRYFSSSQGIYAKYLGDTVYLACYAKLTDGSYVYTRLVPYSPIQYAHNKLQSSGDMKLKQLVVSMLNYGAEAQRFFNHNTASLANDGLTAEQLALPERYREDMVRTVPAPPAEKLGGFTNNLGFSNRKPAISFEGAFSINYFFTPKYVPVDGIAMYYWTETDYNAANVLTVRNATGVIKLEGEGAGQYQGNIEGISARKLSEAVYVAAVYSDGVTTWTSGVLGYSIGSYCASQISKGADVAALAMATAVYGYHAKQYFG